MSSPHVVGQILTKFFIFGIAVFSFLVTAVGIGIFAGLFFVEACTPSPQVKNVPDADGAPTVYSCDTACSNAASLGCATGTATDCVQVCTNVMSDEGMVHPSLKGITLAKTKDQVSALGWACP